MRIHRREAAKRYQGDAPQPLWWTNDVRGDSLVFEDHATDRVLNTSTSKHAHNP